MQQECRPVVNAELAQEIGLYKQHVVKLLEMTDVAGKEYAPEECAALFQETEEMYRHLKSSLLKAGTKNLLPVGQMVSQIDLMSDIRRIADQIEKGARYLTTLTKTTSEMEEEVSAQAAA
jgi:phosphate:Na+ symporter